MESNVNNSLGELVNSSLGELVEAILSESFGTKYGLVSETVESLEHLFEEVRARFESPEVLTPEFLAELESFERCRSYYCLLLLELELHGKELFPSLTLGELLQNFENTVQETPKVTDHRVEEGDDAMSEKTMIAWGISGSLVHSEPSIELNSPLCPSATWYLTFSEFVATNFPNHESDSTEKTNQISALSHCWALECELGFRLRVGLSSFWNIKSEAIISLLQAQAHSLELRNELRDALDSIGSQYSDWMATTRFPIHGVTSSLRYILSSQTIEKFAPAPLDLAVLTYFFGQDLALDLPLTNHLGVKGVTQIDITELFLRMTRVQKIKMRISNPQTECDPVEVQQLKDDLKACFPIVLKLTTKEGGLQAVA